MIEKLREGFKDLAFESIVVDEKKYLIEPILNNESVYVIGAGYISQKIAKITKMLGFKTISMLQ